MLKRLFNVQFHLRVRHYTAVLTTAEGGITPLNHYLQEKTRTFYTFLAKSYFSRLI